MDELRSAGNQDAAESQADPRAILGRILQRANEQVPTEEIKDAKIARLVEEIANAPTRAVVRVLLACCLAKVHRPRLDIRKPYTQIGGGDSYSGRAYDEEFVDELRRNEALPLNATTGFLTPAFRNINTPLLKGREMSGKPEWLYETLLQLLDDIQSGRASASAVMETTLRHLIRRRDSVKKAREEQLRDIANLSKHGLEISAEGIVDMLQQHLACPNSSRLPVLIVSAAYKAAGGLLKQDGRPLSQHTAADSQTGAIGDLEVVIQGSDEIVVGYEMKDKPVAHSDIDSALSKISARNVSHYIFVTTHAIDQEVLAYAKGKYALGVEIAVLDCVGFARHFLHMFHSLRTDFLDFYEDLLLSEPSAHVSDALKETWLSLRKNALAALAEMSE